MENDIQAPDNTRGKMDYTDEFMIFWRLFPGRYHEAGRPRVGGGQEHYWKIGKRKAMEQWAELTNYQKKWAMYSVKFMRKGKYVPDPHRWLKDGKYEDIDLPEEYPTVPAKFLPKMKTVPSHIVNVNDSRNANIKALRKNK